MPTALPPNLDAVDALVQLSFLIQALLSRLAAPHDVSLVQVRLLGVLRDRKPGMLELAALLGLDKSSTTGLIDRAERRGLVKRSAGKEDRRAVIVSLAPAGRSLVSAFEKDVAQGIKALLSGLRPTSREKLTALANELLASEAQRRQASEDPGTRAGSLVRGPVAHDPATPRRPKRSRTS